MPKVQIPKEEILEAALQVILRDGHRGMNIKTVAAQLGRSTQTVSWAFGNMENFRKEVADYALSYANRKLLVDSPNVLEEYGGVGYHYIDLAFDAPNLIRFLRSDGKNLMAGGGFGGSFDPQKGEKRKRAMVALCGCTPEQAERYMLDVVIYTQGLVSLILAGGVPLSRENAHQLLATAGAALLPK